MASSRLQLALEWPLAILALLVIPVLIIEERAVSAEWRTAAQVLNWIIWLAFCADFLIRWGAERRWRFLRSAWFDLALIVLTPPFAVPEPMQGARSVRVLRLLRLLRAGAMAGIRSEEHTSELQSRQYLVCRLLLE